MEATLQSGHVRLCTLPSFGGHFGLTTKIPHFRFGHSTSPWQRYALGIKKGTI